MRKAIYCNDCGKRAQTYYDKDMFAVDGAGYVTDCGTGGCGFSTGTSRQESRDSFVANRGRETNDPTLVAKDSNLVA